jgi:hypothetical protein
VRVSWIVAAGIVATGSAIEAGTMTNQIVGWVIVYAAAGAVIACMGRARLAREGAMNPDDMVKLGAGAGGVLWVVWAAWKIVIRDLREIHAAKEAEKSFDLAIAALKKIIADQQVAISGLQKELKRVQDNSVAHIEARYRVERQITVLREEFDALRAQRTTIAAARSP